VRDNGDAYSRERDTESECSSSIRYHRKPGCVILMQCSIAPENTEQCGTHTHGSKSEPPVRLPQLDWRFSLTIAWPSKPRYPQQEVPHLRTQPPYHMVARATNAETCITLATKGKRL
jgi:hypothetical protein